MVFPVVMYGCESWTIKKTERQKNWCFWTVVLEKTLENPVDSKEIQPVHPKGDQSSVFIGRTDVEAKSPILWPPDAKSWLIWKDPDAGKDWGQEEKRTTEDEVVGWHHRLSGHGFGWTPGVCDGQGSLACYSSWGRKESDMTEQLNWTDNSYSSFKIHFTVTFHLGIFTQLLQAKKVSNNQGIPPIQSLITSLLFISFILSGKHVPEKSK